MIRDTVLIAGCNNRATHLLKQQAQFKIERIARDSRSMFKNKFEKRLLDGINKSLAFSSAAILKLQKHSDYNNRYDYPHETTKIGK